MPKLIECLKELKLINKKMQDINSKIVEYSSALSSEKPIFGTEEEQKRMVQSYLQSNLDLGKRYCELKLAIDRTNIQTIVEYCGKNYSIHELIQLKRIIAPMYIETYKSLLPQSGTVRLARMNNPVLDGKPIEVVRFYDEQQKNQKIGFWQDFCAGLDAKLEIVCCITDVIE